VTAGSVTWRGGEMHSTPGITEVKAGMGCGVVHCE